MFRKLMGTHGRHLEYSELVVGNTSFWDTLRPSSLVTFFVLPRASNTTLAKSFATARRWAEDHGTRPHVCTLSPHADLSSGAAGHGLFAHCSWEQEGHANASLVPGAIGRVASRRALCAPAQRGAGPPFRSS